MKAKKTIWSIFRDYVNSKPIGIEITRQELIKQIEEGLKGTGVDIGNGLKLAKFSTVTLDCARNMSEKMGYLAKTNRSGIYKVVKYFDPEYTVSQLRKDYDVRCKHTED